METIEFRDSDGFQMVVSREISVSELAEWLITIGASDVEILAPESIIDELKRSFPLNSKFKEILEQHTTTLYATEEALLPTAVINREKVYYYIQIGKVEKFVELAGDDIRTILTEEFESLLESATRVEIDTPAWSELLTELESIVGSPTRSEFEQLIEAAQLKDMNSLDVVSVAIIAAAQSGALTYDLGKWAEEVGVASKATISRRKSTLEDDGIIYTEKVPVEIGRPRQRLVLADDVSAVRVEDSEVDVTTSTNTEMQPDSDRSDSSSTSETEPSDEQRTATNEDDDLIAVIEQEIQEIINLE